MTRNYYSQIINFAKKHNGMITSKDAKHLGIHREYLRLLVKKEQIVRIQNGIYAIHGTWEDPVYVNQVKKKQSIYSHATALYLNGLSDREPLKYAITVPYGYHYRFKSDLFTPHFVKRHLLDVGKTFIETEYGNNVTIYNKERSICDVLRMRNRMDKQLIIDALKRYVKDPKRNIPELLRYAKLFRVDKILRTYLEVLL
jgi:predicted transcriptional regulator of viral defense system